MNNSLHDVHYSRRYLDKFHNPRMRESWKKNVDNNDLNDSINQSRGGGGGVGNMGLAPGDQLRHAQSKDAIASSPTMDGLLTTSIDSVVGPPTGTSHQQFTQNGMVLDKS